MLCLPEVLLSYSREGGLGLSSLQHKLRAQTQAPQNSAACKYPQASLNASPALSAAPRSASPSQGHAMWMLTPPGWGKEALMAQNHHHRGPPHPWPALS